MENGGDRDQALKLGRTHRGRGVNAHSELNVLIQTNGKRTARSSKTVSNEHTILVSVLDTAGMNPAYRHRLALPNLSELKDCRRNGDRETVSKRMPTPILHG